MAVLPKKRVASSQANRGSTAILHDLSHKGRVISDRAVSGSKRTPSAMRNASRGDLFVTRDADAANTSFGEDAIHFHENKSTIMSNFEEWIKLSTDNKITTKNSWQFALIDYFHDLNVIKDGDNINFQRASATLDGCVKIYSSRVESAASETGKLLSGLATKKGQQELEAQASDDDKSDSEGNDDASANKKERRINRVVESTLVPFDAIKIKKLDQELAIDPLFKKALADFDEGGAKSLLLNTLNIDSSGRVVFDATTNSTKAASDEDQDVLSHTEQPEDSQIDCSKLQQLLGGGPSELEDLSLCPSMAELKTVLSDVGKAKSILSGVNSKFTEEVEEEYRGTPFDQQLSPPAYELDVNDQEVPDFGIADIDEEMHRQDDDLQYSKPTSAQLIASTEKVLDSDLMAYFDEKMKTNWRGPEHWRVTALKQSKNITPSQENRTISTSLEAAKKKKKELVLIDFFSEEEEDFIEDLFQKPKNQFQISKRPEERTKGDCHILPDDIQFNSQKLVNLFLKPNTSIMTFSKKPGYLRHASADDDQPRIYTDENYFAEKYSENEKERREEERQERLALSFHQAEMDDYDNDNYGGIDFNDLLESNDNPALESAENKADEVNDLIVKGGRKARPEYVNFSRVAKRVDIKLLKDNLWKSIKIEENESPNSLPAESQERETKEKKFTDVVDVIGTMYRPEEKKDLSTSFCFICLLHLANEHGLSIKSTEENDNLVISGF